MKLSDVISGVVEGRLLRDGEFRQIAFATEMEQEQFLTFLEKEKFIDSLNNPNISCVLVTPELADAVPPHIQGVFVCDAPKAALFDIHNAMAKDERYVGTAFPTKVGKDCSISPLSYIDPQNVIIGDHVTIEPFAVIKGRVTIGNHAVIHSGVIVGCKGFSFSKDMQGNNVSVIDAAEIIIEDHVELFEQMVISTGLFPWEKTIIGENTKVDAQCLIGHGAKIGRNCLIAEGARCCGNSCVGDNTWIGVGAIVSNRVCVGSNARVSIGAVVTKDVPDGMTVTGNFAIPHQRFLQNLKESVKEKE